MVLVIHVYFVCIPKLMNKKTHSICHSVICLALIGLYCGMFAGIAFSNVHCEKNKRCMVIEKISGPDEIKLSFNNMVGSNSIPLVEHIYRIQCQRGEHESRELKDVCQVSYSTDDSKLSLDNGVIQLQNNEGNNITLAFHFRPRLVSSSGRDALSCRHPSLCNQREYLITIRTSYHQLMRAQPGRYEGRYLLRIVKGGLKEEKWQDIIVEIQTMVKVSGLSDIVLTEKNKIEPRGKYSARYLAEQHFCIYSSSGAYSISAVGSNLGPMQDAFYLSNGINKVRYGLRLATDNRHYSRLRPRQVMDGNNASLAPDCSGASNIKLKIVVLDSWLSGKPAGTYSDIVYLHVMPQ